MLIELNNETTLHIDTEPLEQIASALTDRPIELIVTNNQEIQKLNQAHRQKEKPTDVLSFPLEAQMPHAPLGSIVISEDFVRTKATEYGHTPQEELTLLFIHGLLHLLGFDHECDDGQMRKEEERLIKSWNLPESLIIRTEESQ